MCVPWLTGQEVSQPRDLQSRVALPQKCRAELLRDAGGNLHLAGYKETVTAVDSAGNLLPRQTLQDWNVRSRHAKAAAAGTVISLSRTLTFQPLRAALT